MGALMGVAGVSDALVNLLSGYVKVFFDERVVGVRTLIKRVKDLGYEASVLRTDEGGRSMAEVRARELTRWRRLFWVSFGFSFPVFLISMVFMFIPATHKVFTTEITKGLTWESLLLTILTTPVQFGVGWKFYVGAYHALRNKSANMDVLVAMGTSSAYFYSLFVVIESWVVGTKPEGCSTRQPLSSSRLLSVASTSKRRPRDGRRRQSSRFSLFNLRPRFSSLVTVRKRRLMLSL